MENHRSTKVPTLPGISAASKVTVPTMPQPQWSSMEELLETYQKSQKENALSLTELGGLISLKTATNKDKAEGFSMDQSSKIAGGVKKALETPDVNLLEFLRAACIGSNEAWILLQMSPDTKHHQSGVIAGITALMEGSVESFPMAKVECIALFILACFIKPALKDLDAFKTARSTSICIPMTLKEKKWTLATVTFDNAVTLSMCRAFRMATCRDFSSYRKLIMSAPSSTVVINPADYKKKVMELISAAASGLK